MLFDLRHRGRRRTVQAVYLGLAVLMFFGLVLFGVGAGNGFGGLLNAFTGSGSSGAQKQVVSQLQQAAERQTQLNPNDPTGWANMVQATWTSAGQGSNYSTTTGTFTAAGKRELASTTQAWQRYLQLTKSPDPNLAILAARAYAALGDFSNAAKSWEMETNANPNQLKGYECLAVASYAAKQTRKADLAAAKAISLAPKLQQATLKAQLQQVKSQAALAAQQC
jgi:predicted Zn-dependent protease